MLQALLQQAVDARWINDRRFRHIEEADPSNPYCQKLVQALPKLRNEMAHGSASLTHHSVWYLERCAELLNQLFPRPIADPLPL